MDELPRQKLRELIATYGRSLCDDPRRCEGLLRDYCGEHKREIHVLVSALKERVAVDLLGSQDGVPHKVLAARLTTRLRDDLGMAEEAARWAVESWALALGIIAEVQQETAQQGKSAERKAPRERKRVPVKKDKIVAAQPPPNAGVQPVEPKPQPFGIRVTDTRASSGWSDDSERRPELSVRIERGGSSDVATPPVNSVGKDSTVLWELLTIPFKLVGVMALLIGSAVIAAAMIFGVLFVVGTAYDQLGETARVLLGLLWLALTVGVLSVLSAMFDYLRGTE